MHSGAADHAPGPDHATFEPARAARGAQGSAVSGTALPGQDTLLACWSALAQLSPGATVYAGSAG